MTKLFLETNSHKDTYIDKSHRYFFRTLALPKSRITQYIRGDFLQLSTTEDISPVEVGLLDEDDCLAGLAFILPLILHNYTTFLENPTEFQHLLESHLGLTHPFPRLIQTALQLTKLLQAILSQSESDLMAMKLLFYETLKNLNAENMEGYRELVEVIENTEISDEEVLKKCKWVSNR